MSKRFLDQTKLTPAVLKKFRGFLFNIAGDNHPVWTKGVGLMGYAHERSRQNNSGDWQRILVYQQRNVRPETIAKYETHTQKLLLRYFAYLTGFKFTLPWHPTTKEQWLVAADYLDERGDADPRSLRVIRFIANIKEPS